MNEGKKFEEIFKFSTIPNKCIVYVNNGENWKTKEEIINKIYGIVEK